MKLNKYLIENKSIKNYWLVFFRISIAFFSILQMFSIWKDIPSILLENSYVKPEIIDATIDNLSPTIYDISLFIRNLNFDINYDSLVYFILIFYLFSLFFLLIGFFTRTFAILSFVLQMVIMKSMSFYLYGADFFLSMSLFYCVIFPIKEFSIDNFLFKKKEPSKESLKWGLILLQSHLSIIYFFQV